MSFFHFILCVLSLIQATVFWTLSWQRKERGSLPLHQLVCIDPDGAMQDSGEEMASIVLLSCASYHPWDQPPWQDVSTCAAVVMTAQWNTVKRMAHGGPCLGDLRQRLQEKGRGPFPQVCFVPWMVLGRDFLFPMTNIYIQFMTGLFLLDIRSQL